MKQQEYEIRIIENTIRDLHLNTILDVGTVPESEPATELHSHSYYELLYSLKNIFFLDLTDGVTKEIHPGELCLLAPGIYHRTRPHSEDARKLALRFRYSKTGKTGEKDSLYRRFHLAVSSHTSPVFLKEADISGVLDTLKKEMCTQEAASKEYTEALLNQLYLLFLRKLDTKTAHITGKTESDSINDQEQRRIWVEEYFHQYYAESVTEEHMAERIGLSKRQTSRVLREIYGKSFRQLLIEERLNNAAQLLIETQLPIEEIADLVGYTSLSGFYTAFRQKFGVTAGKYRKNLFVCE